MKLPEALVFQQEERGGGLKFARLMAGRARPAQMTKMLLEIPRPLSPMEALSVDQIPQGQQWQYEPKWDGFRCVAFRDGEGIELQSKSLQPLARYFPEVVAALADLRAKRFVLDGEIAVPEERGFFFDALLQRTHPAASRAQRLAVETPAIFVVPARRDVAGTAGSLGKFCRAAFHQRREHSSFAHDARAR